MDVLKEVQKRPVMSGITLVGAAGVVVLAMNVMPGLELIVRIKKAPDVADAALDEAKQAREWIEAYIEQQKQQQALEQQRYELEQEFNKQLLELQRQPKRQQVPNQPAYSRPSTLEWQDPETGTWWCCSPDTDCEIGDNWWICE